MHRLLAIAAAIFVAIYILMLASLTLHGQGLFPQNAGYVTDAAQVLTPAEEQALEAKLRAYEAKTSAEVVVYTVTSLSGLTIDEYKQKLFEALKVGKKGKDNGILLVFAPTEGKVGIAVGTAAQTRITDGMAGDIIRNTIRPGWRSDYRANGIIAGVDAVLAKMSIETNASAGLNLTTPTPPAADDSGGLLWLFVLFGGLAGVAGVIGYRHWRREQQEGYEEAKRRERQILREEAALTPRQTYSRTIKAQPVSYRSEPTYVPVHDESSAPVHGSRSSSSDSGWGSSSSSGSSWGSSSSSSDSYSGGGGDCSGGGASGDL